MKKMTKVMLSFATLFASFVPLAFAQSAETYLVESYRITHTTTPQTLGEVFEDCKNDDNCSEALRAAASYFGVSDEDLTKILDGETATEASPNSEQEGEEFGFNIPAPPGYFLCQAHLKVISAAPAEGRRTPTLDITFSFPGMESYAFVHRQQFLGGRSWIDAVYTARYMRYSLVDTPEAQECFYQTGSSAVQYQCKGSGCQANGLMSQ